jgi:hypothetical protein
MPKISICDHCREVDGTIKEAIKGKVSILVKQGQKGTDYIPVGYLCENCYLACVDGLSRYKHHKGMYKRGKD